MTSDYRAKVFKSGNSVALRLPKAWGFQEGEEVIVVTDGHGGFGLRRAIDDDALLLSVYGSFAPDLMAEQRLSVDDHERDWGLQQDRPAAA